MSNSTPNTGTILHISGDNDLVNVVTEVLAQVPKDIAAAEELAKFNAEQADNAPKEAREPIKHAGDFGIPWAKMNPKQRDIRRKEMRETSRRRG